MILKRTFHPLAVLRYVRFELTLAAAVSASVVTAHSSGLTDFSLPFSVATILGSALAIFIAFRNNTAYSRWWDARSQWGVIQNSSRTLARLVVTFSESHSHQPHYDPKRSEMFKVDMVRMLIAWTNALRLRLRGQADTSILLTWLTEDEYAEMVTAPNQPNRLLLSLGRRIYRAMADGTLGGFDSFQMEGQLAALSNAQASCERIKETPLLRQYHFFTKLFLLVFIVLLPLTLISDFSRIGIPFWVIPAAVLISFVFSILSKVGEVNEDPFENRITDVPLTSLCVAIERDVLDILGSSTLPDAHTPTNGFID